VWGDKIFVTSVVAEGETEKPKKGLYFGGERKPPETPHHWMIYCVRLEDAARFAGNVKATSQVPQISRHLKNTFASETPVTDGERVYAYFGNVGLYCYDMEGKLLWKKEMGPFKTRYGWGTAASPVLYKDRIYVVNDKRDSGASSLRSTRRPASRSGA
jgi:outer membrane protein assembly factor BamB